MEKSYKDREEVQNSLEKLGEEFKRKLRRIRVQEEVKNNLEKL